MDGNESPRPGGDEPADRHQDLLASIQEAVEQIRAVDDTPLEEHAEQYRVVHTRLQGALSDTDLRASG